MINLIPSSLRQERIFGRRNRVLVVFIISFVVAAVMVAAVMMVSIKFIEAEESEVDKAIEQNQSIITGLESENSTITSVASRLNATYKLYQETINFSELIPQIGSLLPQGSIVNGLSLTGGSTDPLSLEVNVISADLAPVLQKNLIESELFEAADINAISSTGADNGYVYSVNISVSFTGSADAKKKLKAAEAAAKRAAAEKAAAEESQ